MSNEEKLTKVGINWYPGHMARTKREIKEKLNLIDVIYEVVDSRMPVSSKIKDIDNIVKDKKKIIIFSKYDLCDKEETNKFIKYYQDMKYTVITSELNNTNIKKIILETNNLMNDYFMKQKEKGLQRRNIRVLVIGVPNAGKSTLINKIAGKAKAGVASKPGFTKQLNWIKIDKNIELLDSPGILWPKIESQEEAKILASLSSIKEEVVNSYEISNFILRIMFKLYKGNLKERYDITSLSEDLVDEYNQIAKKRGALKRGGLPDYEKVSKIIISDLQSGKLGKITFDRLK